jgi:predicted DNA-binding transcriptional regulator AlpA
MNWNHRVITPRQYQIAEANGIRSRVLEERVRKLGWSMKDAVSKPVKKRQKHGRWPEIAESNGISKADYYRRVSALNWDMEKAATEPMRNIANMSREELKWVDLKEIAATNNVSYSTFMRRLSEGESAKEAVARPPLNHREHMKRNIEAGKIKLIERKTRKDEIS